MRFHALAALAAAVVVSACVDNPLTTPVQDPLESGPSLAIVDAGNGGDVGGFWFLPPLAKQVTTEGVFDPNLAPSMVVCELTGNPSAAANPSGWQDVVCGTDGNGPIVVAEFPSGSATVVDGAYQFSWDTDDGPENVAPMDPERFYRLIVYYQDAQLGYLDVNPQNPSGQTPGEDYPDLYAFRLGENLPVKFFATSQARCATADDGYVIQCIAQGVIDGDGGVVTLDPETEGWSIMSVVVPPSALPSGYPQVVLTLERIDPVLYLAETGQECIPGLGDDPSFDAPTFGQCLRVTADPELTVALELAALIEICVDPFDFDGLKFDEEQDERLQIIRFDDGVIQGLPNVDATTCGAPALPGPDQLGFFPVPRDEGFLRTAAIAFNTVGRWLGPEPLVAHGSIRLAGSTTNFSTFVWGLPGEMLKELGDNVVIQQLEDGSESYDVGVRVKVVDSGSDGPAPSAIEGASVEFSGSGAVTPTEVTTLADGLANATWSVPQSAGVFTLDATAVGLLAGPVPDHANLIDFDEATVQFTATVVGAPSGTSQTPAASPPLEGAPGETLSTPLVITVVDENGEPVSGWPVTWGATCAAADPSLCDGSVTGDAFTDENGQATGTWTLATTPGANTATAMVGSAQFDFLAGTWSAVGGCSVVVDGTMSAGEWDCADETAESFFANVSGGGAPAEVRWQRDGTNLYMLVKIQQSSLDKVNSLRIDFDNTLNGPSADDDAIGFNADGSGTSGTFIDQFLTSRCVNRSQSGCGSNDSANGGSTDGEGAIGNDGTHTIYELSHPLSGDAGMDFTLSEGNDAIGFFLTLRIGNGAQGNTQYPGFRQYLEIRYQ